MGYRLHAQQPVAPEVRRIAAHQMELAIAGLTSSGNGHDESVHTARRHIKKVRALIRLVRPALGTRYRAVNRRLRVVSRLLAPISDGEATVETLTRVAERRGSNLPAELTANVHTMLARRESLAYEDAALEDVFDTAAAVLRAERDAVSDWRLRKTGFRAIADGLARTARAGRRAMARAGASSRRKDYHIWRRRVKDQWLHVRLLQARCGDGLALDERRLEALDGYLGEWHNCAILCQALASDSTLNRADNARCLRAVRRYERELRRSARRLGNAIYFETSRDFVKRVRRLWRAAQRTSKTPQRGSPWRSAA